MKRNHVFKIAFALTLTSFFSLFVTGVTFSWFIKDNKIAFDGEIGTTQANYYESGDGSESTPFIISNPRHLYNLAWLQYLGTYNQVDTTTGKVPTYYFEIKNDIDMTGYVLPPIGTESNPFLSNFNANNCTISNLTISNVIDDNYIKTYPSVVDKDTFNKQKAIVGFFGVIGTYNSSDSTITYDTSKNEVKNLYLDNLTITSKKDNLLIGVFAGYVNGTIDNCGVHYVKMNIKGATTKLDSFDNVSKFTLIGDYNKNSYSYDQDGSGQTQDWGGSIDFESLNQRLTYIMANSTKSNYSYKSSAFNTNIYYTSSSPFSVYSTASQSAILNEGTYLPLNVDTSKITESNYKSATSEPVLNTNTGYIVGEGSGSNGYIRAMHNKTNKDNSVINCSFYTLNSKAEKPSRSDSLSSSNISFLWLTNDGKTYRIRDEYNKDNVSNYSIPSNYTSSYSTGTYEGLLNSGASDTSYNGLNLIKYNDVKNNFISSLEATTTETFFGDKCYLSLNYIQLKSKSEPTISTYNNVTLNGTTGSYDLFSGGINYTLKKDGYMSMLCGMSYQGDGLKGNLPDIYYVDNSNSTKALKKIYKIIKKNGKTAFKFDDSSLSSDETLVFDLNKMSTGKLMEVGGIYYFEFPMIAGDYFMTRVGNSTVYVPYIYYLDIGANAEGDSDTRTELSNFDFVTKDSNSLTKIKTKNNDGTYSTNNDYSKSNVTFKIGNTTGDTTLAFRRINQDTNGVLYYQSVTGIITPSDTNKCKSSNKEDCTE